MEAKEPAVEYNNFIRTCIKELKRFKTAICFTDAHVKAIKKAFPNCELEITRVEEWYYVIKLLEEKEVKRNDL